MGLLTFSKIWPNPATVLVRVGVVWFLSVVQNSVSPKKAVSSAKHPILIIGGILSLKLLVKRMYSMGESEDPA